MGRKKRTRSFVADAPGASVAASPPHERPDTAQAVLIFLRHAVPLVGLVAFAGSAANFLLLSVFDIGVMVSSSAVVSLSVSTRQEVGDRGFGDRVSAIALLVVVGLVAAFAFTALFGWVIALMVSFTDGLWNTPLWASAAAIVAFAIPGIVRQYRADISGGVTDEQRRRRDQPMIGAHMLSAILIVLVSAQLAELGRPGLVAAAILVTALFVFRDLRPDVMRRLVPVPAKPAG